MSTLGLSQPEGSKQVLESELDDHELASSSPAPGPVSPPRPRARLWLHILLFVVAFCTTTMMGMRYMYNFNQNKPAIVTDDDALPYPWVFTHLDQFGQGIPFAACLLSILLAHEFGHYFACREHGLKSSLPFLLPAPSISGTAGAVIRLQSRIKTRQALLDIGFTGPLWGFIVAVPWLVLGTLLSRPAPATPEPMVWLQSPLVIRWAFAILHHTNPTVPPVDQALFHPILLACWIGILITALNLLPAGQLDGGHIVYSISPQSHKITTVIVIFALILAGMIYWLPWLFWALLLMVPGMKHPSVPKLPLPDGSAAIKYIVAAALFLLCFHYIPFMGYHGDRNFYFSLVNLPQILGPH